MQKNKYIPSLKYHWATTYYDWLISSLMPEKKFKSALLANANLRDKDEVLDFGTGTATLSILAYSQNKNATYYAIDIDDKILNIAKSKINKSNSNIKLLKYNGGKLPFKDQFFDKIITSLVIHHLTDEQKKETFREFKRILKDNGELHIADWGFPKNKLQRLLFHIVQLLDGYHTTTSNVKGKLPEFLSMAGFNFIHISHNFMTLLGTIQIFKIKTN